MVSVEFQCVRSLSHAVNEQLESVFLLIETASVKARMMFTYSSMLVSHNPGVTSACD